MNIRLGNSADIQDTVASNVPTPPSGTLTIFSEGGHLKQKDSSGVVTDLTTTGSGGGGGLEHFAIMSRIYF